MVLDEDGRELTYTLTRHIGNDVIGWISQKLRNDTELVDVVLPHEEWSAHHHFGKDTTCTPDVDFLVVSSPREHDLWCSIESS